MLGQPLWSSKIAAALDAHPSEIRASFVPSSRYPHLLVRPPSSGPVVIMRAGYRPGSPTPRGRAFDLYWSLLCRRLPQAARCHFWLGTDVSRTLEDAEAGRLHRHALEEAAPDLHLTTAPWLIDELRTVGIEANLAGIPTKWQAPSEEPPLPPDFSVLTYTPDPRFGFYGGEIVLGAARNLPDVPFHFVGTEGRDARDAPPNAIWHGWTDDMTARYIESTVVVRVPEHDALGATVIEGLLCARHVVFIHEIPHVHRLKPVTVAALTTALEDLRAAHAAGTLRPNSAGRAYAMERFDETPMAERLTALIMARL